MITLLADNEIGFFLSYLNFHTFKHIIMKYIIVKGAQSSGKAHTITEVCRRLQPEVVRKIHFCETGKVSLEKVSLDNDIEEGNYVITLRKKNVLIVSGAPTEQRRNITTIIETAKDIDMPPDFAIVAMRGLERLKNFSTAKELEKFGKCIHEIKIWRIPSNNFTLTDEWNKRVSYLTAITLHNI